MVESRLVRKTVVPDRAAWERRLASARERILKVLERQPGFLGVEFLWEPEGPGTTGQVTRWRSEEECRRYVRGGGAATVATWEDAALPTAPYPDGTWVRTNRQVPDPAGDGR